VFLFCNFWLRRRFQVWIASKWIEIDQDNLWIGTAKVVAHLMSFAQITCCFCWDMLQNQYWCWRVLNLATPDVSLIYTKICWWVCCQKQSGANHWRSTEGVNTTTMSPRASSSSGNDGGGSADEGAGLSCASSTLNGTFHCLTGGQCINATDVCNGVDDCDDASDESFTHAHCYGRLLNVSIPPASICCGFVV